MKSKKFDKQKKRLCNLAEKWIGILGLKWWTIQHLYYDDRKQFIKSNGREVLMRVNGDWRYREAEIEVNVSGISEQNDTDLEGYYVHELMHIFLLEMRMTHAESDFLDHEERTAKTLADAFMWVRG